MKCVNCDDELKMEYDRKEDGKLRSKYTCSCGLGRPALSVTQDDQCEVIKNSGEILFDYWDMYDRND